MTLPPIITATALDGWHCPWVYDATALDDTLTALDGWHLPWVYNATALDGPHYRPGCYPYRPG